MRFVAILTTTLLTSCAALQREALSPGLVTGGKEATLAYQADASFGARMNEREWRNLRRAELRALDFVVGGESLEWASRSGGTRGRVGVSQPFTVASRECRRFEHSVSRSGRTERVSGVACRQGSGGWALVS